MFDIFRKLKGYAGRVSVKKGIALFLTAAALVSLLPSFSITAEAKNTGVDMSGRNAYVLSVVTGSNTTENISYFAVRYLDSDGAERAEYIFPDYGELNDGYNEVVKIAGEGNCGAVQGLKTLKNWGYSINSYENIGALQAMRKNEFFFTPKFKVSKIVGVDIFTKYSSKGGNEWDCQSMAVYKVNQLYGLEMTGHFSDQYYINFSGTCQAILHNNTRNTNFFAFNWNTGTDTLFRIEGASKDKVAKQYELVTDLSDAKYDSIRNYDSSQAEQYLFKLDIADEYGAGIEAMATPYGSKNGVSSMGIFEALALEIEYTDILGNTCSINIPAVLSSLDWALNNAKGFDGSTKVMGYMQQGESIAFDATIAGIESVKSFKLRFGAKSAKASTGLTGSTKLESGADKETMSITGLSVYRNDDKSGTAYASLDGGFIRPQITMSPIYYYTANTVSGQILAQSASAMDNIFFAAPMSNYTGSESLTPKENGERYLVVLHTDEMEFAGTSDDFNVKMYYHSIDGQDKSTDQISVKEAMQEFYGYWPGKSGDVSFTYAASAGNDIVFVVNARNVSYFTGMNISMGREAKDNYQLGGVSIYELKSLGKRNGEWQTIYYANGAEASDRLFTRDNVLYDISPEFDEPVLIQGDTSETISFESDGTTIVTEDDVDWSKLRYSMTFSEAKQNLGFTKQRETYTVKVKVADSVVNGQVNEDCGSKNKFYFQLVFEDGSSSYVLANQQLGADGFRTGATETFYIYTNQDYGGLKSVKIIPEDVSEDADSFDKLMVEWIKVTKNNNAGVSMTWRMEVQDWISIDYHDEGEKNSASGQAGRTESEIARTYLVNTKGYSLNLLFAIRTKGYLDNPFEGQVLGTVEYYDINRNIQTADFNLITGLYNFADKTASTTTYTYDNVSYSSPYIDRTWMLRENHTDRFILEIDDVTEILRVTFYIKSQAAGCWDISGMQVFQVVDEGKLLLNDMNEYITTSTLTPICSSTAPDGYELWYDRNGAVQGQTIEFTENDIEVDVDTGSWSSEITYVPQSKDDTINIYAHVSESMNDISSYDLQAAVSYHVDMVTETDKNGIDTTYTDGRKQNSVLLEALPEENVFYATGVKVSGITGIDSLSLQTYSIYPQYTKVDYAIIEHVRSDVIIGTYYLDFGNRDAEYCITAVPTTLHNDVTESQTLTLMLREDSADVQLLNQKNDVAISFNYTTVNDPTGHVFTSPNIFLSEQDIAALKANQIITVNFNQKYVKDITAVTLTAMGLVRDKIRVQSAYVTNDETDSAGKKTCRGWYSFAAGINEALSDAPRQLVVTGKYGTEGAEEILNSTSVAHLVLTFKTSDAGNMSESGTETPIRMKLTYTDDKGEFCTRVYEDINKYLTSGMFSTGYTAVVEMLVSGMQSIRYIEVEPYDNSDAYSVASWSIDSVQSLVTVNGTESRNSRTVKRTVSENEGLKIGLSEISINVNAYISRPGSAASDRRAYRSGDVIEAEGILIKNDQTITFMPEITGSLETFTVKCEKVSVTESGKIVTADASDMIIAEYTEGVITAVKFTPGTKAGDYRIIFTSLEISDVKITIDVSVNVEEKEEPEDEDKKETEEKHEEKTDENNTETDTETDANEEADIDNSVG